MAAVPVDLGLLEELVGDDLVVIREVLQCFEQSAAKSQQDLEQALRRGTTQAAVCTAHNLKSAARYIGAHRLGEICSTIEETGQAGRVEGLRNLLPLLQAEMEAVRSFIRSNRLARA